MLERLVARAREIPEKREEQYIEGTIKINQISSCSHTDGESAENKSFFLMGAISARIERIIQCRI